MYLQISKMQLKLSIFCIIYRKCFKIEIPLLINEHVLYGNYKAVVTDFWLALLELI